MSWSYDGFGNRLTEAVSKGSGPTSSTLTSPNTNRISATGYTYDNNGNMTAMPQLNSTLDYDWSNRLRAVMNSNRGEGYAYAPDNRRIWRSQGVAQGTSYGIDPDERFIVYSPGGQKLGVYTISFTQQPGVEPSRVTRLEENVYWGSRLVHKPGAAVTRIVRDRLGSTA